MSAIRTFVACAFAAMLGGCGVFTPEKGLLSNDDPDERGSPQGRFEFTVAQHVMCEIRTGLWKASKLPRSEWLRNLGAQVTLTLVAEDQSALSSNASFLTPIGALASMQSFTLGIGGSGSANATRTETIQFTYPNKALWREAYVDAAKGITGCEHYQKGILIESDLKIGEFIYDKAVVAAGVYEQKGQPFSQLQFTINFVASFSGNITPTWKLTRTTVNGSGSLLSATRTNTDTVIITLGPLNTDTKALHNAAVISNGTGQAVQSNTH